MSFDTLAPHYRWMEHLLAGGKLQRCRVAWLNAVRHRRRVLLVGEGPGRFLAACLAALPEAEVVCLDASVRMLEQARKHAARGGRRQLERVRFLHATLPDAALPAGTFDLVVTHFFLDCFPRGDQDAVIAALARAAAPEADWLVADFLDPAGGWRRLRARAILGLAYGFFGIATGLPARRLAAPDEALARQGFRLENREETEWGLLGTDLWRRNEEARPSAPRGILLGTPEDSLAS